MYTIKLSLNDVLAVLMAVQHLALEMEEGSAETAEELTALYKEIRKQAEAQERSRSK